MQPIENILLGPFEEGVREKVDFDEYADFPAMNPSTIVMGAEPGGSMKHLKYAWEHERADTDDFLWGRALHCLLFEPQAFPHRYAPFRGKTRKGKEWDDFQATAKSFGMEILTEKQWDSALEAAKSFVTEPRVQELIQSGQPEVMLLVVEDGVQCKGRLDWIPSSGPITDLKTSKNIAAKAFGYDFFKYHYDIKLGLYRRWWHKLTGQMRPAEVIAIEKLPPYDVVTIPLPDAVLDRGAERGLAIIRQVKECIASGVWPGVAKGQDYYLEVPFSQMDDAELEGVQEYSEAA